MTSFDSPEQGPQKGASGRLAIWVVLGLLTIGVASLWSLALREALRPTPPQVLVRAPQTGEASAPYPVQVLAFDPVRKRRATLRGHVGFSGEQPVTLKNHLATLKVPSLTGNEEAGLAWNTLAGNSLLRIDVVANELPVRFEIPVEVVADMETTGSLPRWSSWEFALDAPSPDDLKGKPVYPLFGQARSSLSSDVLLFKGNRVSRESLLPHAAFLRLQDGRRLRLDRSGITISAPNFVRPGERVALRIRASAASERLLSVFVDGQLNSVRPLELRTGENQTEISIPSQAATGAVFEVHLSVSAFQPKSASHMTGMVVSDPSLFQSGALETRVADNLRRTPLFAGAQDPLLAALWQGQIEQSPEIWQAMFSRFRSRLRFPGRVGPSAEDQQRTAHLARLAKTAEFRLPFRVSALFLALFLGVIAWRAGQKRRVLDELLRQEWLSNGAEQGELPSPWRRFGGGLWATLGLLVAFAAMGALDWTLHFVLLMR